MFRTTTRDAHRPPTYSPTFAVGSLDLRKREEFKQSTSGSNYNNVGEYNNGVNGNRQHNSANNGGVGGQSTHDGGNNGILDPGFNGSPEGSLFSDMMNFGSGGVGSMHCSSFMNLWKLPFLCLVVIIITSFTIVFPRC